MLKWKVEIPLQNRSRSLLFSFVAGGASLLLAAEIALTGIASSFKTPSVGRWLVGWDSGDAGFHYRLARVCQDLDPAESARHLRWAAQISPESRLYWSDLATACEFMGDTSCADSARERLLKLCPMVPHYYLLAAQAYLRTDRTDSALTLFRRLLELDPSYALATWYSLQPLLAPDLVYQNVLAGSANAETKVGYANFLSDQGDDDAAYRVWKLAVAGPHSIPFSSARPYLERLIDRSRIDEAKEVWQDLEDLGTVQKAEAKGNDNLVFNGDFEQFPLNAAFDWRWSSQLNYLSVDFSALGAYHGAHCLRIDFAVSRNQEYEPVYQIVPVQASHTYRLEAYIRSEDITSDTGPFLRVSDTAQPGFHDTLTETTIGTTPWHLARVYFSTGPKTQAVRLSVWRPLGRVFPTEISGTFWLDAVSLQCVDCESGRGSQEAAAKDQKANPKGK
jgi:tetratricopeptide (TPR) repeat protein